MALRSSLFLFPNWTQAYKEGDSHWIASIYRLQKRTWGVYGCLRSYGRRPMWKNMKIAVITKGVGLHATCRFFLKARRLRVFTQEQFCGAVDVFHACPRVIFFR